MWRKKSWRFCDWRWRVWEAGWTRMNHRWTQMNTDFRTGGGRAWRPGRFRPVWAVLAARHWRSGLRCWLGQRRRASPTGRMGGEADGDVAPAGQEGLCHVLGQPNFGVGVPAGWLVLRLISVAAGEVVVCRLRISGDLEVPAASLGACATFWGRELWRRFPRNSFPDQYVGGVRYD
jgi:hypothetical protein